MRLGDLAEIGAGQGAPQGAEAFGSVGIPFIRASSLSGLCDNDDYSKIERIDPKAAKHYGMRLCRAGTIVFAKSGMSATKNRVYRLSRDAYVVNHLATVKLSSSLDVDYFRFWLEYFDPTRLIKDSAYPSISQEDIAELEICAPNVNSQRVISRKLQSASRLRRIRRAALEKSEGLLGAVFLEMFGDPTSRWRPATVEDLCSVIVDCPHSTPKYVSHKTQYPCIRSSDLQHGELDFSTTKYVDRENYIKRVARLVPEPGDIIYCREGERFGNAAQVMAGQTPCLGQRVMLLRPKQDVAEGTFLLRFLVSPLGMRQAEKLVIGTTSPHVNVADVVEFRSVMPPIDLQRRFTAYSRAVQKEINICRESLRQADHLFQTLLHKAFGEDQFSP
jgi:type I restriction enzyme S subunit